MKDSTKKTIVDFVKKILKYKEPIPFFLRPDFQQPIQEQRKEIKTLFVDFEIPFHVANNEEQINKEICRSVAKKLFDENAINYKKEKCQHVLSFHHGALQENNFKITATFKYL